MKNREKSSFRKNTNRFKGSPLKSAGNEQTKRVISNRRQLGKLPSANPSFYIRKGVSSVNRFMSSGASRVREEASSTIKDSNQIRGQKTAEEELTDSFSGFARETKQTVTRTAKDTVNRIERNIKRQPTRLERTKKTSIENKSVSRNSLQKDQKNSFRKTSNRGAGNFQSGNNSRIKSNGNRFSKQSRKLNKAELKVAPDLSEGIRFLQGKAGKKAAEKAVKESAKQGIKQGVRIAATTGTKAAATTANVASGGTFGAVMLAVAGVLLVIIVLSILVGSLVLIFFRSPMGLVFGFGNYDSDGYEITFIKSALTADMDIKLQGLLDNGVDEDPTLTPQKNSFAIDYKSVFSLWAILQSRAGESFEKINANNLDRVKEAFYYLYQAKTKIELEDVRLPVIPERFLVAYVENNTLESIQETLSLTESEISNFQTLINYDEVFWTTFLGSGSGGTAGDFVISNPGLSQQISMLPEGDAKTMLTYAASCLGWTYSQSLGGTVQGYHDCSSLVQTAAAQIGVSMPRTTWTQVTWILQNGKQISQSELRPGDLIYWSETNNINNATHTGIYVGGGMIIDASSSRGKVVYRQIWGGQVLYARITS